MPFLPDDYQPPENTTEMLRIEKCDLGIYDIRISKDSEIYKDIMREIQLKIHDMGVKLEDSKILYINIHSENNMTILAR
jgi:hypothetical protein